MLEKTDRLVQWIEALNVRDVVEVPPDFIEAFLEVQGEIGVDHPLVPLNCGQAHDFLMDLQARLTDTSDEGNGKGNGK